ncbi:MAG: hypothetical protein DCC75_04570 [Proteobacteria bacterium]|nr:MAG: hypothetical protein DCC75_04570 [Pseudomonadota bacterium]
MANIYQTRIRKILSKLNKERSGAALVISSAAPVTKTRDLEHPFRQSSDFYYLTGSYGRNLALVVKAGAKTPYLLSAPVDRVKVLWDGASPNPKKLAASLGAELIISPHPDREILKLLRDTECLYFQNEPGTVAWKVANELIRLPSHSRIYYPYRFHHSDLLLQQLRLHKDRHELRLMQIAADVTVDSLLNTLPFINQKVCEEDVANSIDYFFKVNGCSPSFSTIVACGKSAATLHHHPGSKPLRRGELLLIDCGAEFQMYAADITRTVPVSGRFEPWQRDLYQVVLAGQHAALSKIKHGVLIESVYMAAARTMLQGLLDMRVVRGKLSTLLNKKAYKEFFPHSIGHPLGLDVHDIGNMRGDSQARLESGMVFTVEPGLYFPKAKGTIKPCGIRIEDDVLVTKQGCELLTAAFPKGVNDIEELMGS